MLAPSYRPQGIQAVLTLSTDYTARASLLLLLSRFSRVRLFVTP